MSDEKVTLFGIWIPNEGWLKGKDVFADESLEKTQQVAKLIGRNARVYFIDTAIIDFERQYLEQEKRTVWHIFKNFLQSKIGKSSNKG